MKKVHTPHNYQPYAGKKITQKSMTIPDQTMSVREILSRFTNGLPLDGAKAEIWEEQETNGINPKTLDLVDIQEMMFENSDKIETLKQKYEDDKRRKQEERSKAYEKELERKATEIIQKTQSGH